MINSVIASLFLLHLELSYLLLMRQPLSIFLKAARIRRAPLIRATFRGLVKSDAGTLRKEVPASLSPRPPG